MAKRYSVVMQRWEESERGWGTRSDGYTLHLTTEDCAAYAQQFAKRQHEANGSPATAPDAYTRTAGSPQLVDVSATTYNAVKAAAAKGETYWGPGSSWEVVSQ